MRCELWVPSYQLTSGWLRWPATLQQNPTARQPNVGQAYRIALFWPDLDTISLPPPPTQFHIDTSPQQPGAPAKACHFRKAFTTRVKEWMMYLPVLHLHQILEQHAPNPCPRLNEATVEVHWKSLWIKACARFILTFSHLAEAFIQSDSQVRLRTIKADHQDWRSYKTSHSANKCKCKCK